MRVSLRAVLFLGALAALAIPSGVFLVVALYSDLGAAEAVAAMVEQMTTRRQNLLVCGALGLFPILLLSLFSWGLSRWSVTRPWRAALAVGGLLPILAVLLWINFDFWPLFLPARTYPGFPHGLGFIIGPAIFAPIAMVIGMVTSGLVLRFIK